MATRQQTTQTVATLQAAAELAATRAAETEVERISAPVLTEAWFDAHKPDDTKSAVSTARQSLKGEFKSTEEWDAEYKRHTATLLSPEVYDALGSAIGNAKALVAKGPALYAAQRDARVTLYGLWYERHSDGGKVTVNNRDWVRLTYAVDLTTDASTSYDTLVKRVSLAYLTRRAVGGSIAEAVEYANSAKATAAEVKRLAKAKDANTVTASGAKAAIAQLRGETVEAPKPRGTRSGTSTPVRTDADVAATLVTDVASLVERVRTEAHTLTPAQATEVKRLAGDLTRAVQQGQAKRNEAAKAAKAAKTTKPAKAAAPAPTEAPAEVAAEVSAE